MRCPYCSKGVVGSTEIVMVLGEGPAHLECYQRHAVADRSFNNIHFPSLSSHDLKEMKEMILAELNIRERDLSSEADGIELFG